MSGVDRCDQILRLIDETLREYESLTPSVAVVTSPRRIRER